MEFLVSETVKKVGNRHACSWWSARRSQGPAHRHSVGCCKLVMRLRLCCPLFHMFRTRSRDFADHASRLSPHMALFADGIQTLLLESSQFQRHLNNLRERVRDDLSVARRSESLPALWTADGRGHGNSVCNVRSRLLGSLWPTSLHELWITSIITFQSSWP